jgi:hypothetical protein
MSCEKYKSRLLDFALGAEEADLRAHLEAWLRRCPESPPEISLRTSAAASLSMRMRRARGLPAGCRLPQSRWYLSFSSEF